MSVNVVLKSVFDDKGIRNAEKAFSGLGSTIGKFAGVVGGALAIGAVTNYAKDAISAASNLSAEIEGVNQIFGDAATSVQEFAKTASSSFGIARADALQAAKNFGGFATSAGLSGDAAASFATNLVAAAGDLASFADVPVGEALAAIQSGLAGQSEPLRKFQIFLDDTTLKAYAMDKGLGDSYSTMTQGEKALLRQGAILDQLGVKQGDFINYQDTFGNALKTVQSEFQNLQAEVGMAMLPAMEELLAAVKEIIPEIGEKLLTAVNAVDWTSLAEKVGNFLGFFIENIDTIIRFASAIAGLTIALSLYQTAVGTATAIQAIFNSEVIKNPYVAMTIALLALVSATVAFANSNGALRLENQATEEQIRILEGEQRNLSDAFKVGAIDAETYERQLNFLQQKINGLRISTEGTAGEINRFNNLLAPLNADKANDAWAKSWIARGAAAAKAAKQVMDTVSLNVGSVAKKETSAERFKAVQKVIKAAQEKILKAEEDYARTKFEINRSYDERTTQLTNDATLKRLDIVKQSMMRLTGAFKTATQVSLGDLFDKKTTTQLETSVKQLSSTLAISVTRETESVAYSSVDSIIAGLQKRLSDSKLLLQNASELASKGFSQTFIEQVVQTGAETGNALAGAILDASPETQSEMRQLFKELETVSNTGMDSLAQEIYDKQGLATVELKTMYEQVQIDLNAALISEQKALGTALADAGYAFGIAIKDIKTTFLSDLEGFDGWFAGLGKTIDALLAKMGMLSGTSLADTQKALTASTSGTQLAGASVTADVAVKNLGNASGIVIDSVNDVAGTLAYLEARIKAANSYIKSSSSNAIQEASAANTIADFTSQLNNLKGASSTGSVAGTVININVKTDTTQSQAMVGKTIGNIVTKYVTTGGTVLVSGNA